MMISGRVVCPQLQFGKLVMSEHFFQSHIHPPVISSTSGKFLINLHDLVESASVIDLSK